MSDGVLELVCVLCVCHTHGLASFPWLLATLQHVRWMPLENDKVVTRQVSTSINTTAIFVDKYQEELGKLHVPLRLCYLKTYLRGLIKQADAVTPSFAAHLFLCLTTPFTEYWRVIYNWSIIAFVQGKYSWCINQKLRCEGFLKEASKSFTPSRRQAGGEKGGWGGDRTSQALGQQVSVWRQGMTDASVSVPTVAALWELCRCPHAFPSSHPSSFHPSILAFLWTGWDGGITRQEQSSQQSNDRTGTGLPVHVDSGAVQVWARRLKGSKQRWGGVINVGVSVWGQGKGSLAGLWEAAETRGPWQSCLWGKQMFSLGGVPSLQSNLQLLGGQVFNKGVGLGTFPRQTLQLWYNNILIMTVDHRAEGCSKTSHPTGLEPRSGRHSPRRAGRFNAVPAPALFFTHTTVMQRQRFGLVSTSADSPEPKGQFLY